MGRELFERCPGVTALLTRAECQTGRPLCDIALRGPRQALARPATLEPLLTVIACGYVEHLWAQGLRPQWVAGYSAGETSALYAAGVLDRERALRVAVLRGRVLEAWAGQAGGAMLGVYGAPREVLESLLDVAAAPGEQLAVGAYNGPRHITVTGTRAALGEVVRRAQARGVAVADIEAAGPWHCGLLAESSRVLARGLGRIPFAGPKLGIVSGVNGAAESSPEDLRRHLALQLSQPIRWDLVVEELLARGVRTFVEIGPGRMLHGLLGQMALPVGVTSCFLERPGGKSRAFREGGLGNLGRTGPARPDPAPRDGSDRLEQRGVVRRAQRI
jgi:[acyl-carrier-protein] S-malonyltransferase